MARRGVEEKDIAPANTGSLPAPPAAPSWPGLFAFGISAWRDILIGAQQMITRPFDSVDTAVVESTDLAESVVDDASDAATAAGVTFAAGQAVGLVALGGLAYVAAFGAPEFLRKLTK